MNNEKAPAKLPKISDLYTDPQEAFKNDELNKLLHQPPPQAWVKKQPMAKTAYLPIDKVELLLTRIFQKWRVEVISYSALFNSVSVHVRLHYLNPISGDWEYQDGVGASPVQTDKGKTAADLGAIKNAAIQMALPAAKSYAVKDAAEQLGPVFGANLNRKDTLSFTPMYKEEPEFTRSSDGAGKLEGKVEIMDVHSKDVPTVSEFTKDMKLPKSEDL